MCAVYNSHHTLRQIVYALKYAGPKHVSTAVLMMDACGLGVAAIAQAIGGSWVSDAKFVEYVIGIAVCAALTGGSNLAFLAADFLYRRGTEHGDALKAGA